MGLDILYLSQEQVRQCGGEDIKLFIDTMETVFSLHDHGQCVLPPKTVMRWGDMDSETVKGRINSMPGYVGGNINACGIKWIASSPQNPFLHQLPRASGIIILNDPETLVPIAIMDGTLISAMRTGANSGVVAKYLAREDSKVLGLIGAGVQNRTQLLALHATLPQLQQIKLFDINHERAQQFAAEMGERLNISIDVVNSAEEAVSSSDVFVTATVTKVPIVKKEWIKEGALYIHVGSHECEFDVIRTADKVIVDDWAELKHRGVETISIMYAQGLLADSEIDAELGEIVNGKKPGRESQQEIIYFNSVGMGIEDVAIAQKIYERAVTMKVGTWLSLWDQPAFV